jgi:hypothetical protein
LYINYNNCFACLEKEHQNFKFAFFVFRFVSQQSVVGLRQQKFNSDAGDRFRKGKIRRNLSFVFGIPPALEGQRKRRGLAAASFPF